MGTHPIFESDFDCLTDGGVNMSYSEIPDQVRNFIRDLQNAMDTRNVSAILQYYETDWTKMTERYFKSSPWPHWSVVEGMCGADNIFILFYKELYFRHLYMLQSGPSHQDRVESFENYCEMFNYIINPPDQQPVNMELPNQWLWDIIDEFIYQFQNYSQYRSKLQQKDAAEIALINDAIEENVWSVHSVLNVLQTLVERSKINEQLKAYNEKKSMDEVYQIGGVYGQHQLYKMLGYFSLIGLLRLQTQLGDYHQALKAIENVSLGMKTSATDAADCLIATYYYEAWAKIMLRKYQDAIDSLQEVLLYIERGRKTVLNKDSQYKNDMLNKMQDKMFHMLAICTILYPCRIDESLEQSMKEKITFDKLTKMQDGDAKTFEEVFSFSCPKFVSPTQPLIADPMITPATNTHLEPTERQWRVFEDELDIQSKIPGTRRYLKLYTTMPLSKLAAFMDVSDSELLSLLMAAKCKLKNSTDNYDETNEDFLHPEVDFFIDDKMVHIADTRVGSRYGEQFIRKIQKFIEMEKTVKSQEFVRSK